VVALCARAGLVELGVVAVDGTKIAANATRNYEQIAREILEDAAELERRSIAEHDTCLAAGIASDGSRRMTARHTSSRISTESLDTANLHLMLTVSEEELHAAGVTDVFGIVLADAGYWTRHPP
jgi:hypothetical protein